MKTQITIPLLLPLLWVALTAPAAADSRPAGCELFHHGDRDDKHSGPCEFSQRQGYVTIRLKNGKTFELSPTDQPKHYRDQKGHKVKLRNADAKSSTLMPIMQDKILPDSVVYTDSLSSYNVLDVSCFKH